MGRLQGKDIDLFLKSGHIKLQRQAIAAAAARMDKENAGQWLKEAGDLFAKKDSQLAPYTAFLGDDAGQYAPQKADRLLLKMALQYKGNPHVSDAVISGLAGREEKFLQQFQQFDPDTSTVFYHHLKGVITHIRKQKKKSGQKTASKEFTQGKQLFETYCQSCHGADGNGIRS
jgi:hypothetical protein